MPPTTTTASGRCTWLPIAVEKAAGNRPTQAAAQVISTGRICTAQVSAGRPRASRPASIRRLKQRQHHDAVHGGDAEQGDEADGGRDAERHAEQEQREDAADQRHRDGAAGEQRVAQRAEADEQQQQDQRDGDRHGDRQPLHARSCRLPNSPTHSSAVAARHLDLLGDPLLGLQDGAAEVAAAHAELDRDVALLLLAVDVGGAGHELHVGDLGQRHLGDAAARPARRSGCGWIASRLSR